MGRPEPILAARSDKGAVSLQATGHCNTGYQVLSRTPAARQKSMCGEDNQNIYQSISCKLEFGRWVRGGVCAGGGRLELHGCTQGKSDEGSKTHMFDTWQIGEFSTERGMMKSFLSLLTFLPLRNFRHTLNKHISATPSAVFQSQACFIDTGLITNMFQSDVQSKQRDLLHPYALDSDKSPQTAKW